MLPTLSLIVIQMKKTNCDCDICLNYSTHSNNYSKARDLMDSDGVSAKHDPETIVVTGDMIRVIPIPILKAELKFLRKTYGL